jgi:hypothetical protein
MEIKQTLENAIVSIEREREVKIQQATQLAISNDVVPYEREIDETRNKAIEEITAKANAEILAIQKRCETEKQAFISAGEEKKKAFKEATIQSAINTVTYQYNTNIAKLKKLIEELGE